MCTCVTPLCSEWRMQSPAPWPLPSHRLQRMGRCKVLPHSVLWLPFSCEHNCGPVNAHDSVLLWVTVGNASSAATFSWYLDHTSSEKVRTGTAAPNQIPALLDGLSVPTAEPGKEEPSSGAGVSRDGGEAGGLRRDATANLLVNQLSPKHQWTWGSCPGTFSQSQQCKASSVL